MRPRLMCPRLTRRGLMRLRLAPRELMRRVAAVLSLTALLAGAYPAAAASYRDATHPAGIASTAAAAETTIRACTLAAARLYHLPPVILVILLNVEGGQLGKMHGNSNGTVDIGPMQVNQIWLPVIAAHWQAGIRRTFHALRDNFCANVTAGAFILHRAIAQAHGHLWQGVAIYHSEAPRYQSAYLRAVLAEVRHLQTASVGSAR
jgi:hypothetical protein